MSRLRKVNHALKRLLFAAEPILEASLGTSRLVGTTLSARIFVRSKDNLRGRQCHCPPGLGVHLVHSEGLREGADVVVDYGTNVQAAGRPQAPVQTIARVAGEIGNADIVYVKTNLLDQFCESVFPKLGGPIVLVTGESDRSGVRRHSHLLDSKNIVHWFAQNCDIEQRHRKLTRIPIGIDNPHYNKLERRIGFLADMAFGSSAFEPSFSRNDMGEQHKMQEIAAKIRTDPREKPVQALCTFHMNQKILPNIDDVPARKEAYEILKTNPVCHFVSKRLSQDECWRRHDEFAFEISPRGKGLDCFRTWESLFLGTIPIVMTTTLDPLYLDEKLPVVIVQSWHEVTAKNLARWKSELEGKFGADTIQKLGNDYWLGKFRAVQAEFRSR